MFVTKITIGMTISMLALAASSSIRFAKSAPVQASVRQARDVKGPEKSAGIEDAKTLTETTAILFPDGLVHDFGKVLRGTQATHTFRIVNRSNVALQIVSLRWT
jgi:hypothetical protein